MKKKLILEIEIEDFDLPNEEIIRRLNLGSPFDVDIRWVLNDILLRRKFPEIYDPNSRTFKSKVSFSVKDEDGENIEVDSTKLNSGKNENTVSNIVLPS